MSSIDCNELHLVQEVSYTYYVWFALNSISCTECIYLLWEWVALNAMSLSQCQELQLLHKLHWVSFIAKSCNQCNYLHWMKWVAMSAISCNDLHWVKWVAMSSTISCIEWNKRLKDWVALIGNKLQWMLWDALIGNEL